MRMRRRGRVDACRGIVPLGMHVCSTGMGKVSGCRCRTTDTWADTWDLLLQQDRVQPAARVCLSAGCV